MQTLDYTWRESLEFQLDRVRRHLRADLFDILYHAGMEPALGAMAAQMDTAICQAMENCKRLIRAHIESLNQNPRRRRPLLVSLPAPESKEAA